MDTWNKKTVSPKDNMAKNCRKQKTRMCVVEWNQTGGQRQSEQEEVDHQAER